MTKFLAFSACVAALVALLVWPGNADPARHARADARNTVTADEVEANLRQSGLTPVGPILRDRDVFVTHAIDPRGVKLRVVADALFGDIVSAIPAQPSPLFSMRYDAGPRIIHIPPRGEVTASVPRDDDDVAPDAEEIAPAAAVPPRRIERPRRATPLRHDTRREHRRESRRHAPVARHTARAEIKAEVKPEALEVKARRSVLAIPPAREKISASPPPPATPRWQSADTFDAPRDVAAPPPSAVPAEGAHASADVPVVSDADVPPEGITADPAPAH